jgi:arylsulfatase A-like enzyme
MARPKNIVWFFVDSLRHDVFARSRGLFHDLAARGLDLSQCITQGAWTYLAAASVLTGRNPIRTGASRLRPSGDADRWVTGEEVMRVRDDLPTLFTHLRAHGYETLARADWILGADYGYRDWTRFDEALLSPADLCYWIGEVRDRPFVLFVRTMTTHFWWGHDFHAAVSDGTTEMEHLVRAGREAEVFRVMDDSLAHVERHEFLPVLREVERLGLMGDTLFVVHADHGDTIHETRERRGFPAHHGGPRLFHGGGYEEVVRVPAFVAGKGVPARRIDSLTRLVDLLPTVLAAAGVPPVPDVDGVDLLSPGGPASIDAAFFEGRRTIVGVRTATHKLVRDVAPDLSLCFDLAADPGERRPLADPDAVAPLAARLAGYLGEETRAASAAEEARYREVLADLGYLT